MNAGERVSLGKRARVIRVIGHRRVVWEGGHRRGKGIEMGANKPRSSPTCSQLCSKSKGAGEWTSMIVVKGEREGGRRNGRGGRARREGAGSRGLGPVRASSS